MPETSFMKGISVLIRNMCIKQHCNHKVEISQCLHGSKQFPGRLRKEVPAQFCTFLNLYMERQNNNIY